jgi:hypothetical protein
MQLALYSFSDHWQCQWQNLKFETSSGALPTSAFVCVLDSASELDELLVDVGTLAVVLPDSDYFYGGSARGRPTGTGMPLAVPHEDDPRCV